MRKIGLLVVAAAAVFIVAGAGEWFVSSTHARVDAAADVDVNPMQIVTDAWGSERFIDLTTLFE